MWKVLVSVAANLAKLQIARKLIEDAKKEMKRREAAKKAKLVLIPVLLLFTVNCALYNRTSPCDKLRVAEKLACSTDPGSSECVEARDLLQKECGVTPEPPTPPPPTPPEPPPPVPPVDPPHTPPTPPTPPTEWKTTFPVPFPSPGARIDVVAKRYNAGLDATIRFWDTVVCGFLSHQSGVQNCHTESDVWSDPSERADYEGFVIAGARSGQPLPPRPLGPVWRYKAGGEEGICHDDRSSVNTSCDHFGDPTFRDDPQTPDVFEGKPSWLRFQSDEFGPYAGWFMVPQTSGPSFGTEVQACLPDLSVCSGWVWVDWR